MGVETEKGTVRCGWEDYGQSERGEGFLGAGAEAWVAFPSGAGRAGGSWAVGGAPGETLKASASGTGMSLTVVGSRTLTPAHAPPPQAPQRGPGEGHAQRPGARPPTAAGHPAAPGAAAGGGEQAAGGGRAGRTQAAGGAAAAGPGPVAGLAGGCPARGRLPRTPPPPPGGSWSLCTPRTPSAHAGVPSGGRVFSSGRSHSGPHDDMSFLPGSKWGSEEGFWGALGGGTTVGSSHRSHIHLTAKPFNGPLPGGAGPPVPKGKGPKSMAPGSLGSSLPETSQLSLTILPRASEKGLREGGPVACPYSLPPHSRLAPGDQAAGTEVLATKALSLVLSHGQVQGQGCVSGILGPPPSPQARRGSAIAPPHHHESPAAPCSPRGPWLQNRAPPVPTVRGRARRQL